MRFAVDGHFSGHVSQSVGLVDHAPWVYIIVCVNDRLIYIGETYDRSGLVVRLSSHFGILSNSTLRKQAARIAGVYALKSPYLVVAARLPTDDRTVRFDASSKAVRLLIESMLHQHAVDFAAKKGGWTVVSNIQETRARENRDIIKCCDSIAESFGASFNFLEDLTRTSPFHLVTLSMSREPAPEIDPGALVSKIEVLLFEWLLETLKREYGDDKWWTEGIPINPRRECATRREEEGSSEIPREAYLTLIDFRDIIRSNWMLFRDAMERMSGKQGKDRATSWLVELNDIRKLWAHPIKQKYHPISQDHREKLQGLVKDLQTVTAHARDHSSDPNIDS